MTDRIEAIRARHAARMSIRGEVIIGPTPDDDMAVLLAEVERQGKVLEELRALAARWIVLSRQAMDQDVREWTGAAGHSVLAKLNASAAPAPVAPDAEPEQDWRPLGEDVSMHTMAAYVPHNDMRMCGYHSRLGVWTFDNNECLRDHPTMAQIMASAPGDEEPPC